MMEFFRMIVGMEAPFNMIVLVMLIIFTGLTITRIAGEIRKYFCNRDDLEFKRELLSRGMSVEEADHWLRLKR